MKGLFRKPDPGLSGYAALTVFALAYLAVLAIVVAPGAVLSALNDEISVSD